MYMSTAPPKSGFATNMSKRRSTPSTPFASASRASARTTIEPSSR